MIHITILKLMLYRIFGSKIGNAISFSIYSKEIALPSNDFFISNNYSSSPKALEFTSRQNVY